MFGKPKSDQTDLPPVATGPDGDPWDRRSLDWLKGQTMLSIQVTNLERRYKSGPSAPHGRNEYSPEIIVTGYLPHAPQHVHLQIEFNPDLAKFGNAWLTFYVDQAHPSGMVNIPYIAIQLSDKDGMIQSGLLEAMRDAVAAGGSVAEARVWPKIPSTWDDPLGGHTRHFDIDGMIVWANMRSPRLESWALPLGEFDLAAHPDPRQLRRKPVA